MKDEPFQTNNRRLAEALITAGCTLAPREKNGPSMNIYTAGKLRDLRIVKPDHRLTEKELEIYTLQAVDRKKEGDVFVLFEQNAMLGRCIKAFDDIEETIKLSREWEKMDDGERLENEKLKPGPIPDIPEEVVMQVLSLHSETRKAWPKIAWANPALCSTVAGDFVPSGDETRTGVPAGTHKGKSARVWSIHLNNEDRAHMKLHPRIAK